RGITLGEKRASIKMIRMLQSILEIPESTDEEFADKSVTELEAIIATLQMKVSNRPTT
ncbi:MAG: hypothetical protein JNL67_08310, partial [Planctomycetaceae bacterium]|nr:hypothetical protein [Planctomycetaceae bacterium]